MKRCPQCGREYDTSMMFCLDDGAELLYGPASGSEPPASAGGQFDDGPQTAILSEPGAIATGFQSADENPTQPFIHTTASAKPQENKGESSEKQSFSARRMTKPLLIAPVALAIIILGGFFGYRYFIQAKQIESIAVMPFVNESGNADVEYLSDGMTETLIKSLSQVPNLAVKSRSTVFYYKGKETSPKKIGEELGVQAVLLGRVGGRGDDLKLSLELVDTKTQNVIWSEQYDRKQSELVSLQSEIAKDVSTKLKSKLSGAGRGEGNQIGNGKSRSLSSVFERTILLE